MVNKFFTVSQIDGTVAGSPHERELRDFSASKFSLFRDLNDEKLRRIVDEELGAKIEDIGFREDWTITLEFFPEANIHVSYFYYGDEFGDIEGELRFLFSGERVCWIPGEDLVTYTGIVLNFIEDRAKNREPYDKNYDEKSELMKKILEQRKEPFKFLREEDADELEQFLGARVARKDSVWSIKREVFPGIFIEVTYDESRNALDISYSGKNLNRIGRFYHELIGTFLINHIPRYITTKNLEKKLPDICYKTFSILYAKEKGW